MVTNWTHSPTDTYKIPRWFLLPRWYFWCDSCTFSQASCLATDLVENLFLFISCAAGGRRGRMQNVMIWIFPFSALVSVQNVTCKVVGRKEKKKKKVLRRQKYLPLITVPCITHSWPYMNPFTHFLFLLCMLLPYFFIWPFSISFTSIIPQCERSSIKHLLKLTSGNESSPSLPGNCLVRVLALQGLTREKASCCVCVTRNTQLGNNANDKYSFRFTKFKGNSDSFPILRTFAAYFRPSPQALAITKPKKFHRAILLPKAQVDQRVFI